MSDITIPVTLFNDSKTYIKLHYIDSEQVSLTLWLLGEGIPFTLSIAQDFTISLPLIPNPILLKSYIQGGNC